MGALLDSLVPPIVVAFRSKPGELMATFSDVNKKVGELDKNTTGGLTHAQKAAATMTEVGGRAMKILGTGVFTVGAASVKLAGDFQEATTQLVTGGGESESALAGVRSGLLQMAPLVGQGPVALAKGMYLVESAGYHGAQGLLVMKAAAEGATVGASDTATVADALTTVLKDYNIPAKNAAMVTSQLVETVASGKTNMQDLASAIHNVAPKAAAAGVSLQQMLGAIATMTGEGISADQATQDLANSIQSLQNPTQQQRTEMDELGLSATDISLNLGKRGLTGTMNLLEGALAKHLKLGTVWLDTYKNLQEYTQSARIELSKMPAAIQPLAKAFMQGTVTQAQMRKQMKGMGVANRQLLQEFDATVSKSRGFNDSLTQGGMSAQSFGAALAKLTGGATGMNVALAIGGKNAGTFQQNVQNISHATADAHGNVKGFSEASKDFNFQLHALEAGAQALAIKVGQVLIPIIQGFVGWIVKNKWAVYALGAMIGTFITVAIAFYIKRMAVMAKDTVTSYAKMIASGAKWVQQHATQSGRVVLQQEKESAARKAAADKAQAANTQVANSERSTQEQLDRIHAEENRQRQLSARIAQETSAQIAQANGLIGSSAGEGAAASAAAGAEEESTLAGVGAAEDELATTSAAAGEASALALGPIGLAIAAVMALLPLLLGHWKQIWGGIKSAAEDVWNDALKPVFHFIVHDAIGGLMVALHVMGGVFGDVWGGMKAAAEAVWNDGLKPVFEAIKDYINFEIMLVRTFLRVVVDIWHGIENAFRFAWDDVIKPVFGFIRDGLHFLESLLTTVGRGWANIWGGIEDVVKGAWDDVLKPVFGFIDQYGIEPIKAAVQEFGTIWSDIWNGIQTVVQDVWNIIKPIIDGIKDAVGGVTHVVSSIVNGVGGAIGDVGSFFSSLDTGGPTPGMVGKPTLAIVHGGEFMLSNGMLNGQTPIPSQIAAAVFGNVAKNDQALAEVAASASANGQSALNGLSVPDNRPATHHGDGCLHVTVQGSVIDTDGLFRAVQTGALRHGTRNSQTWQPFKRR